MKALEQRSLVRRVEALERKTKIANGSLVPEEPDFYDESSGTGGFTKWWLWWQEWFGGTLEELVSGSMDENYVGPATEKYNNWQARRNSSVQNKEKK